MIKIVMVMMMMMMMITVKTGTFDPQDLSIQMQKLLISGLNFTP